MSDSENKAMIQSIDEKVDQLPKEDVIFLSGFVAGLMKARADGNKPDSEKEGA